VADERVLVVDDSILYRDLVINHVLEPNDYFPLVAEDGQSGLKIALEESPDLIIIDMQMPGLTGIEVLEELHELGSEIPVILMTLHGSEDLVVRAFRMGVKDYVIKPFGVEEMLAAIDRALTEMRLRRERDALTEELIETNKQLDSERRQLETVLTDTADAVLLVDDTDPGQVILANLTARRVFGLEDNVIGQRLSDVVDDNVLIDVFHRATVTGEPSQAEINLADESTLNASVTPIPGVGKVAVMQDITYFKELDRMKSEFVSTVSHDLRSPLTSIKGFADLLPTAGELNEQQLYFLQKVRRGIDMITVMISDLLDLGRIEAEVRMDMELCDLQEIVEEAVDGQLSNAELKKQNLGLKIDSKLPAVRGNVLRLGQAISNLVSNAVKYTPDKGNIQVSVASEGGQVVVTVEDDGIGIPQEDLPYIFDKFYRVESPETEGIVGSGLGLSMVKTIAEKHQGRIWAESEQGVGTSFYLVLPATSASR
jgi:signal transduction histidine kinase